MRVVVFRDEKGVKTPVFDSQINCDPLVEEGDKVGLHHTIRGVPTCTVVHIHLSVL